MPRDAPIHFGMDRADALAPLAGCRLAEWSYLDEPECRPAALRAFRRFEWIRKVVWSVRYERVEDG